MFWSDSFNEPIPPGASVLLSWSNNYWAATAGQNRIRAEIEAAPGFPESNATNNSTQVSFAVAFLGQDTDGDGMADADELIAGTNPQDSSSVFHILSGQVVGPSEFVLTWSSVPGKRYRIQSRSQPADFEWTEISGDIRATATTTSWTNSISGTNAFGLYRVLVFSN